ncbi:ER membrane protein complex subunit 2-like [Oppia nitens]|uniref:ER membrane protein complex subunit 2-like n=1 Tax=Oppia nitens TaxID=1686743 RepID=UPI0023DC00B3|nr:ER membrane protein complex subunit 2-like [Oppia nitens]
MSADPMSAQNVSKMTKIEAKQLLQKWREDNVRNSETVRDIWLNMDFGSTLGDEKWQVLEQVCIAAIDLHDNELIKDCLQQLDTKFANSSRVRRLKIMAKYELRERFEDAFQAYEQMIEKDESNSLLYKRQIAILLAERRIGEAIKELCDYLKKFMNDTEAWLQLSDLYVEEQEYNKAAYCVEELILANPHNHLYHERYAAIQYTINTTESLELSRTYFSQALRLNPNNLRALYGLLLAANSVASLPKTTSQKKRENLRIASWASNQISRLYKDNSSDDENRIVAMEGMLANLQITSNST